MTRQRVAAHAIAMSLGAGSLAGAAVPIVRQTPTVIEWRLDNLAHVGGRTVTVVGSPRVVPTELGPAVEFNGASDGLFVESNPIAGLERFTIEVVFQPAAGGPDEQRFLHIEEPGSGSRALIELRMLAAGTWSLDTYLRYRDAGLTLLDRANTHSSSRWHVAALSYDGKTMVHYVDGVRELHGDVEFGPLASGRTSIGVRQNRVSWFKGRIHSIRVTPEPLPPERLQRVPAGDRVIPLWPEGVPGARPNAGEEREIDGRVYNVQAPTLTYIPAAAGRFRAAREQPALLRSAARGRCSSRAPRVRTRAARLRHAHGSWPDVRLG